MLPFKKRKENHPPDPPKSPEPSRADNSILIDAGRSMTRPMPVCNKRVGAGRIQE